MDGNVAIILIEDREFVHSVIIVNLTQIPNQLMGTALASLVFYSIKHTGARLDEGSPLLEGNLHLDSRIIPGKYNLSSL